MVAGTATAAMPHFVEQQQQHLKLNQNNELNNDLNNRRLDMDQNGTNNNNNNGQQATETFEVSLAESNTNIKHNNKHTEDDQSDTSSAYEEAPAEKVKCSAVHTLERDMPDFDYSHLVSELREKVLADAIVNPGWYSQCDLEKCRTDDWYIARFLLRHKLDMEQAFDMIRKALRFNHESLLNIMRPEDFPAEFYKVGGLFPYEEDRKGNKMLYIRGKVHKKIVEIQAVFQAFLYYNIQALDKEANGKGTAIVLDCSGAGLVNADMDMLFFLVSTLKNYFPKGMSYLLVHELPWILKPFWHIAKAWVAEEHRQLIKFSNSRTIFEYIDEENLPDFMGGSCKRDYTKVPDNCSTIEQAAKLWGVEKPVVKRILMKFAEYLPPESLAVADADELSADSGEDEASNGGQDSDQENKPMSQ